MNAIAIRRLDDRGAEHRGAPSGRPEPGRPETGRPALERARAFALELLAEQGVPLLARRTGARALGLLLARSAHARGEPVFISAQEAARACDFEPRTWWLVKRRLLGLGHLVASTGGGPPSGKPGGRGHKGAYFVAPPTLERFLAAAPTRATGETGNPLDETGKGLAETLNPPREERDLSHHRPSSRRSLRLLERKRTSDVPSLEGDERPSVEAVWAWARSERSVRVKLRLLRLLETLLVTEALAREPVEKTVMAPEETVMGEGPRSQGDRSQGDRREHRGDREQRGVRRPRAAKPLWSGEKGEEGEVLAHVRSILAWANKDHGASFDVERSTHDTRRYPFEQVRSAVANVLLKRARGYPFVNPGAVLWDGITLEGYKLDEFSVACLDEVLARIGRSHPGGTPEKAALRPEPARTTGALRFEPERQRRQLLQGLYQKLPEATRRSIDERAEALAREELGELASPRRVRLLQLDKKNELLAALPEATCDAGESQRGRDESQISDFAPGRDETEPNVLPASRT